MLGAGFVLEKVVGSRGQKLELCGIYYIDDIEFRWSGATRSG
jgi:hypothetical protein